MTSYFKTCDVTLINLNHKNVIHFLTCTCASHFEKDSVAHGHCPSELFKMGQRPGVGWRPGQEANLAPPCSYLRPFASKCTALKRVLVALLGLYGARRIVPPLTPSLYPWKWGQKCLFHNSIINLWLVKIELKQFSMFSFIIIRSKMLLNCSKHGWWWLFLISFHCLQRFYYTHSPTNVSASLQTGPSP